MKRLTNLPASVHARLLAHAKATHADFNRTLARYAIERFLYRLSRNEDHRDRFVLKGAMLFITWPGTTYRPTSDLDLLAFGSPDPTTMRSVVAAICTTPVDDDAMAFDPTTIDVESVRVDEEYLGLRVSVRARLGNTRLTVPIDIGFGDHVHPEAKAITFPCLLPGMEVRGILAYPPETVVAEKFEAMVRLGETNGRLKDFNDIWVIANTFTFEMPMLLRAITGTFTRRAATLPSDIPMALTDAFAEVPGKRAMWDAFLDRNPPAVRPPPLPEVLVALRRFIGPVLAATTHREPPDSIWSPQHRNWSDRHRRT